MPGSEPGRGDPAPVAGRPASLLGDRADAEGVGHDGHDALEAERLDEHQIHPALAKPHGVDETTR